MAKVENSLEQLFRMVEEQGVLVEGETRGFRIVGQNLVFPYMIVTLCIRGHARALYDMKEMTLGENDLGVILPGHVLHPIDCSDDYTFISTDVSRDVFREMGTYIFSHDYKKFHSHPVCHLTEVQAQRIISIMNLLQAISQHRFGDLEHRRQMLTSQLAVGYEFINFYRKELDHKWDSNRHAVLFAQFCDLVVMHFREAKDMQFYLDRMAVHPKLLKKVVREATNGLTPKEWIEQYVITQAKRMIEANPSQSFKRLSFSLGFSEPSSFFRYFKRVTGVTAKTYRDQLLASSSLSS